MTISIGKNKLSSNNLYDQTANVAHLLHKLGDIGKVSIGVHDGRVEGVAVLDSLRWSQPQKAKAFYQNIMFHHLKESAKKSEMVADLRKNILQTRKRDPSWPIGPIKALMGKTGVLQ